MTLHEEKNQLNSKRRQRRNSFFKQINPYGDIYGVTTDDSTTAPTSNDDSASASF